MTSVARTPTHPVPDAPSPAELRAILAKTSADLRALRAQRRASLAEQYRARVWWVAKETKAHAEGDAAILAALREGKTVRAICASLKVGTHRIVRLRAYLAHSSVSSSSGPDPSPLARA